MAVAFTFFYNFFLQTQTNGFCSENFLLSWLFSDFLLFMIWNVEIFDYNFMSLFFLFSITTHLYHIFVKHKFWVQQSDACDVCLSMEYFILSHKKIMISSFQRFESLNAHFQYYKKYFSFLSFLILIWNVKISIPSICVDE